jgi:NAD(P)-dependent dehydrogenase (short-subunit alcohol dehydrogenase family)
VPDVIVSNAGVFPEAMSARDLTEHDVIGVFQSNTLPLLTISKLYASSLRGGKSGRLIALGSLGSIEIWKQRIAYNVSKSALLTLARALARDWAPMMSINVVAPGAVTFEDDPTEGDKVVAGISKVPMGRHATVDDVFDAVWFFSTASHYITGQLLCVDGGYHLVR